MNKSDKNRVDKYKKDPSIEYILEQMNRSLYIMEKPLIESFIQPNYPVIFIIGAQRSGTTLLMQLLTKFYNLSFPNNFISRYWGAPYIGATLYKSFQNQLTSNSEELSSDLGYTKGLNGPHEFSYFWKQWFTDEVWNQEHSDIDFTSLPKKLASWESVKNTPLIFKNLIQVNHNIFKLKELIPNAFFIHIKRDLLYNVQSTYLARIKLFGDEKQWVGVKPKNYISLKKLPVFEQITQQVKAINTEIETELQKIDAQSQISITYEDLVRQTNPTLTQIAQKIGIEKFENSNIIDIELESGNKRNIDKALFKKLSTVVQNN